MRYVEAGPEARLLAWVNGIAGVVALVLGETLGANDNWWILPVTAAAFAALVGSE